MSQNEFTPLNNPAGITTQVQDLLCLDGISHLFISCPREGELMLFGTDKENNAANIYSSALTPAGLSLALGMAGIRAGCFSSSVHSSKGGTLPFSLSKGYMVNSGPSTLLGL